MDREALREALDRSGAVIGPGLTDAEFSALESRYGFRFAHDHRLMLSIGLPSGSPDWPDWRDGDEAHLRWLLAFPVEGVRSSVEAQHFWWPEWGERPHNRSEAVELARGQLSEVPQLVPLHTYRFISSQPAPPRNPVFSIYGTDAICVGADLLDYLRWEFGSEPWPLPRSAADARPVEFWSQLVERRAQHNRATHRDPPST